MARNGLVPVPMREDNTEVIRDWQVTVVERGGEVVAMVVLGWRTRAFCSTTSPSVPTSRAEDWGAYLLQHAEAEAVRQGFDSIYLYAQEIMTENLALYQKIGYVDMRGATSTACARVPAEHLGESAGA